MRESMAGVPSGVSWRGSVSTSHPKALCWTEPAVKAAGARLGTTSRIMSPRIVSRTVVGAPVGEGVGAPVVGCRVGIMVMVGAAVPPPSRPLSMVTPTAMRTAATTRTPAPIIMSLRRRLLGPPAAAAPSSFFFLSILLLAPPPPPLRLLLFLDAPALLAPLLPLLSSDVVSGVWLDSTSPVAWEGARVSAAPASVSRVTLLVTDAKPKVEVSSIMLVTLASPADAPAPPPLAEEPAPYRSAAGSVAMAPAALAWAEPIMESSAKLSAPRSPNSSRSRSLGFSILCCVVLIVSDMNSALCRYMRSALRSGQANGFSCKKLLVRKGSSENKGEAIGYPTRLFCTIPNDALKCSNTKSSFGWSELYLLLLSTKQYRFSRRKKR
mmetsp:Transcript_27334/g.63998  ORF Transcript_27334/g.63998 Transcript_27334/m.63998 type:complete len:381 (-) Transcript_27334:121-1263(-)